MYKVKTRKTELLLVVKLCESLSVMLKGPLCKIYYHLIVGKHISTVFMLIPEPLTPHLIFHLSYSSCDVRVKIALMQISSSKCDFYWKKLFLSYD